jgi:hypothetical protein
MAGSEAYREGSFGFADFLVTSSLRKYSISDSKHDHSAKAWI